MGMIIEISEEKIDEISSSVEDMLHIGGRLMSCIERLREDESETYSYGRRTSPRKMRINRREEDWRDYDNEEVIKSRHDSRYM